MLCSTLTYLLTYLLNCRENVGYFVPNYSSIKNLIYPENMFSIPLFLFPYTLVTKGLTYLLPPNKTKRKKYLHSFTLIHTRYFNEDYPFLGLRYFWLPDKSPAAEGLDPGSITNSIIDTECYLPATEAPTTIGDWDILTNKWTCLQNQSTHNLWK